MDLTKAIGPDCTINDVGAGVVENISDTGDQND